LAVSGRLAAELVKSPGREHWPGLLSVLLGTGRGKTKRTGWLTHRDIETFRAPPAARLLTTLEPGEAALRWSSSPLSPLKDRRAPLRHTLKAKAGFVRRLETRRP
jgi:hypothetical protein